ncbi:unnamed protein product, partial [Oncorhynchus mykiss]
MSAVLAITDRRSSLFQILFAVFDSLEGFVIVMVHCILRREVQEAVKCRVVDRQEDGNGDSGGSFQNGHAQLMAVVTSSINSGKVCTHSIACPSLGILRVTLSLSLSFASSQISLSLCHSLSFLPLPPGTLKRSSLQGDEKPSSQPLTLQKGSNFNTMPASMA